MDVFYNMVKRAWWVENNLGVKKSEKNVVEIILDRLKNI